MAWGATLASALPARASAPQQLLTGRVTEQGLDDYGVAAVTVRVQGTDVSATTDKQGRFSLKGVPEGPVVLVASAPDYETLTQTISAAQRARPLMLSMVWEGEQSVATTVIATRSQPRTASTTELSGRDLTSAPRRNAEEILRQVPGLTLVQHGSEGKGHQFFLRGFDAIHGSDLELTVDGMPINEWSNVHAQGYLDLGLIIPEMVRSVVVTKGPFTLEQGAFGMAGSADYRLGVPLSDLGLRAAYTVGTTNRHRVFAGYAPLAQNGRAFVGMEAAYDEGFGSNRGLTRASFNGRARVYKSPHSSLHVTALGSLSSFELPGTLRNDDVQAGVVDFYGAYDSLSQGDGARGLLSVQHQWASDGHKLSLTGYGGYRRLNLLENFTGFLIDPIHGDRRDQSQRTWSFGGLGKHESPLSERLALRTGLGVRGDVFSQQELNVGRALETIDRRRDLAATQLIAHTLVGLRWSPVKGVRVDAGARADLIHVRITDRLDGDARSQGSDAVVSPRVSARWRPLESWRLFLAYGRGFRPPEARAFSSFDSQREGLAEDVFTGGDPRTTVSDAFELGTAWNPSAWFGVNVSGFATFIERESLFDHVSGINLELNGTRRVGGELVVSSNPLPWLSLGADLTWVDARFVESGRRVPLAPWLTSGARATVTHPGGARAGLRVLTVAPRQLPHQARGATLVMTDATLGFHGKHLRLDLEIENLLDRRLREGEYHYASDWSPDTPTSELPVLHTTAGPPLNARLTVGVVF